MTTNRGERFPGPHCDLAVAEGTEVRSANRVKHETREVLFDGIEIPAEALIGKEGQGFRWIPDGLNVERTLIAAERVPGRPRSF